MENKQKKLMILGGSRYILPLIKKAHELGIFVITCDYLPNNYAHKFSDLYVNISILDKEKVLEKARELEIDGISSFACDPGVITAAYVAEQLGLPASGPYESICILQNKGKFRDFLKNNNFNVPMAKQYKNKEDCLSDLELFSWPVIVKPTDSAGSKGVMRVDTKEQLFRAIDNALMNSHSHEFIIEDFLEQKGYSSDSDSFSIDGKMIFYSFSSQLFDSKCENPYTPSAYYWPTTMKESSVKELKREIQRLVSLLGMKTSIYNIETRECVNGKTYIMEMSPRGGGNRLSEMIRYVNGIDLIEMHILSCLNMPTSFHDNLSKNNLIAEFILHGEKSGFFVDLWVDESIKNNIVEEDIWVSKKDYVGGFKGANEAIGTLVLRFDSKKELKKTISNFDKLVMVRLSDHIE